MTNTAIIDHRPNLESFMDSLKSKNADDAAEDLIQLLRRRQIKGSHHCAEATIEVLLHAIAGSKAEEVPELMSDVRNLGLHIMSAQPRELVVGNIVRRVLGLIREVSEPVMTPQSGARPSSGAGKQNHRPRPGIEPTLSTFIPLKKSAMKPTDIYAPFNLDQSRPPFLRTRTHPHAPGASKLFKLFKPEPDESPDGSPARSPSVASSSNGWTSVPRKSVRELKAEALDGLREIVDEIGQAADQIAGYAEDHIHGGEMVMTHGSSTTLQKFLMGAAEKHHFTIVHVEGSLEDLTSTHNMILTGKVSGIKDSVEEDEDDPFEPLASLGCIIRVISEAEVFGWMPMINKVIYAPRVVMSNGSVVDQAGARNIAAAASCYDTPMVVLSAVYKLSPMHPFKPEEFAEMGNSMSVARSGDWEGIDVMSWTADHVEGEKVRVYITNLGGHAPSFLYRIIADHYDTQDLNL